MQDMWWCSQGRAEDEFLQDSDISKTGRTQQTSSAVYRACVDFIKASPGTLDSIWFTDEAHLCLNWNANKQNSTIWRTGNSNLHTMLRVIQCSLQVGVICVLLVLLRNRLLSIVFVRVLATSNFSLFTKACTLAQEPSEPRRLLVGDKSSRCVKLNSHPI